jgi:DNA polymerase elongation subunit (family B)
MKVKRKGAYQYEGLGWHQNQGGLVIPMAAEAEMLTGVPAVEFIKEHLENPNNKWNFMLRTKVPRSSRLVMLLDDGSEVLQQNICRYYISKSGGKLVKIMPALEEGGEERRLSIDSAWKVRTCNQVPDILTDIDIEYYASEAEKLVIRK